MSLMGVTCNWRVILLCIAVLICFDGFKMIVLLVIPICAHWGPLVGSCVVNREYVLLIMEISS